MKLLITGISGFIGQNLIEHLSSNKYSILGLSRSMKMNEGNIKILNFGLEDLNQIKDQIVDFDPEIVVHLAWEGIPDYSKETSEKNLHLSKSFLSFISQQTNCSKIIVSGSCWEYGEANGECLESDLPVGHSHFSKAKLEISNFLEETCQEKGIKFYWFRVFYVYGPGQREGSLIPSLIKNLSTHTKPEIKTPNNSNDFIFIDDLIEAFIIAIEDPDGKSGVYNLGSGKSIKIIEILKMVERFIRNSNEFSSEISKASQENNIKHYWSNIEKIKKNFGWFPRTPLSKGIKAQIESCNKLSDDNN